RYSSPGYKGAVDGSYQGADSDHNTGAGPDRAWIAAEEVEIEPACQRRGAEHAHKHACSVERNVDGAREDHERLPNRGDADNRALLENVAQAKRAIGDAIGQQSEHDDERHEHDQTKHIVVAKQASNHCASAKAFETGSSERKPAGMIILRSSCSVI